MPDIILHNYPESLYAEKIRLILGYKKLDWKWVLVALAPPRPDLVALTGGYRRTPILQIGADVYCDTAVMVEALERIAPANSLYPPGRRALIETVAQWGDSNLFWAAIAYFYQTEGVGIALSRKPPEQVEAYYRDRAALLSTRPLSGSAETRATLALYLQRLQQMLEGGQRFLLGDAPTLADFSCYHPLWCLQSVPPTAGILESAPLVLAWMERVKAIGHGRHSDLSSQEALDIARNAPATAIKSQPSDIPDIDLGDEVEIMPSDYGLEPVRGELVLVEPNHVAVRHHDERAGEVTVHFPRIGYLIKPAGQATQ